MSTKFGPLAREIAKNKYLMTKGDGTKETWDELAHRVASSVFGAVKARKSLVNFVEQLIRERKFMPGGRYLYAAGRPYHQVQNCFMFRAQDSREGWSDIMYKSAMTLMSGGGIGVVYSDLRPSGAVIKKTGGKSSGPLSLMQMVNESGRFIMNGGNRRAAIWAGLHWSHEDCPEFINMKNWSEDVRALKSKDFNFPGTMDMTNISTILDGQFFKRFKNDDSTAKKIYWTTVNQMLSTAEPGFSIDWGINEGENLRNACTEVTSFDDSDVCNLGSLNLARFESLDEFRDAVIASTAFLLAGTVYSDVPTEKIRDIRDKNRRLGLGLMGIHEWLLKRDYIYGWQGNFVLDEWLSAYKHLSDNSAFEYSKQWGLNKPIKVRAIAPTGTIGIVAETTTGIEPIFCVAYKRRYLVEGKKWAYQYVVDPTAKNLIDKGVNPDKIEDAYKLASEPERRVTFQAYVQQYVDHGISSTINLPQWGSEHNNPDKVKPFGKMLMKYLPDLRGITCYPNGARGGQPLTPVQYETAMKHEGEIVYEQGDVCDIKGGSCGA